MAVLWRLAVVSAGMVRGLPLMGVGVQARERRPGEVRVMLVGSQMTDLFGMPTARPQKPAHVPRTSVEAGRRVNRNQRLLMAVSAVERYQRVTGAWPTAEEAVAFYLQLGRDVRPTLAQVLTMRRGLSDAQDKGFLTHAGTRVCRLGGATVTVWKVVGR